MCVCLIILYVDCFGRTVLYMCIEYHIQVNMCHVSAQGVDEHMINVHYCYYYYYFPLTFCELSASFIFCVIFLIHTVCGFFFLVFLLHLNFDIFFQVIQEPVDMWRNIKGHNALVSSSSNHHHLSLFTPPPPPPPPCVLFIFL